MNGRTHLVIGIAAGMAVAAYAPLPALPPLIIAGFAAAGVIGGLLPDIDHPRSIISGYVPGSGLLRLAISHRGPTHTVAFVAAVLALLVALGLHVALVAAVGAGMILHLMADMLTPAGVPLLMPLSDRSWRLLPRPILWAGAWVLEAVATVGALGVIVILGINYVT